MSPSTTSEVVNKVNETGVIPIFYNSDLEICINISKSCISGGLKILEFTNRGSHAIETFS